MGRLSALSRPWTSTWAQAAVLGAAQFAVGAVGGRPDDPDYYRSLRQAPFAPPSWAFGPAWAVARTGSSYALVRTWRGAGPHRRRALGLFAADVAVFVSFSYVYFRRRSPVLAAVWTVGDAALVAALLATLAPEERAAAAALVPQAAWLTLAAPVAVWQAAANPDPLLGTPAPLAPPRGRSATPIG